jgi:flagellar basal-body rod modification protein FlgD
MVSKVQSLPINSGPQLPGKDKLQLKAQDFIKMMITQLQQQDPMEPAKNDQLLAQMSQISQLQSSNQLSDSLKGMVQQNQIGSAATLIGKTVQGLDGNNDPISGLVTSVRVSDDGAALQLDNGQELMMTRVTSIGTGTAGTPTAPAAAA